MRVRLLHVGITAGVLGLAASTPITAYAQTKCIGQSAPIHEKMAGLEENTSCPKVVTINRFRTLLDRITPRCEGETTTGVADGIVTARRLLFERGVEAAYLEIAEVLEIPMGTVVTHSVLGQVAVFPLSLFQADAHQ